MFRHGHLVCIEETVGLYNAKMVGIVMNIRVVMCDM